MKIVVTGAGGLLGRAFMACGGDNEIAAVGRTELNTGMPNKVLALAALHQADVLINCAADTDVEGAERDSEHAHAVNAVLPALLAESCVRAGAKMIHISSTGCYGDWKASPYTEDDVLRPTTVHHRTKALGEDAVRAKANRWMILRTGWLYGLSAPGRKNFIRDRLEEAKKISPLLANAHQKGNPTFVDDVARQAYRLVENDEDGIFNCVAHGSATRRDYVEAIVRGAGLSVAVEAAPDDHFARRAPVSSNETAENTRLKRIGLDMMPAWREAVMAFVGKEFSSAQWPDA